MIKTANVVYTAATGPAGEHWVVVYRLGRLFIGHTYFVDETKAKKAVAKYNRKQKSLSEHIADRQVIF